MQNIKYEDNCVSGIVNLNNKGILQITTSYSKGWKVYVDGKKQEVIKVNQAFIGTIIEEGSHIIEFKYETPFLKLGIVFSILGFILYILLVTIENNVKYNA